ncbi:MAG: segregation/condensation protein A [Minisyncoccia bacterium]
MTEGFSIETSHYSGPLETLLDLIEKRKMSVSKISLAEVCDGYLAYVEKLPGLPLSETSQFVLVASTLLLIKSRALLPTVELSDDEEQTIEELERRLNRLAQIRAASKLLRAIWGTNPLLFAKRSPDAVRAVGLERASFLPGEATKESLLKAAEKLVATLPGVRVLAEAIVAPVVALEDVIEKLRARIANAARTRWSELTKGASRHDTIVHFLAVLELARHGNVSVTQDKLFSDIILESDASGGAPRYG